MALFHVAQLLMHVEIGTVCFLISASTKRNLLGAGLGVAIFMFALDMMCRIIPAIENLKYVTPLYYANAADIFANGRLDGIMVGIGAGITIVALVVVWRWYGKKDLAA